jgi:hypothetical protein
LLSGTSSVTNWLTGIKNKYPEATTTGTTLAGKVLAALLARVSNFLTKGSSSGTQYLQGIKNKYPEATTTGQTLANKVLAGCQAVVKSFRTAGANAGQGFVDGLKSKQDAAASAGSAIGNAAYEAAKKALDEHSPSKKMGKVGENAGLGFINQLMLYVAEAAQAGEDLGTAAVTGASNSINTASAIVNLDDLITFDDLTDPVIKPIVDLKNIENSASYINDMFNDSIKIISGNIQAASDSMQLHTAKIIEKEEKSEKDEKSGNTYQFIQNNTSPKSLSRIEIYRQTKNQFTKFKQEVDSQS